MRGTILVIDDNLMDIKVVVSAIEKIGYACQGFTDYKEAMEWLGLNTPQVIFLDLQMPQISGFDLIPILKKKANLSKTPIIIMSGKKQTEDVYKAISLGALDYIVKPVDPLVVQQKLEKLTENTGSDYYAVNIGGSLGVPAMIVKDIRILSFSEFGVKIKSDIKINPGETIEVSSIPFEIFGKKTLLLRCLSCEREGAEGVYISQMTYIGMTEDQRQVIRSNGRKLDVQAKIKEM